MKNANSITKDTPFEDVLSQLSPLVYHISLEASIVPGLEFDDLQSELMLQVWLCWKRWDPTIATFISYVYPALHNRRNMMIREVKADKRGIGCVTERLDAEIYDDSGHDRFRTLHDYIADTSGSAEERLFRIEVVRTIYTVINSYSKPKTRQIIALLVDGYKQVEVAKLCGCRQSTISNYYSDFRRRLANELKAVGFEAPFSSDL